ncbi:hypothetical protein B0H13DRAFT_2539841 [Mycena leptocephala]|nr:hypothetical protein B0H13DRAFT_2539841 [Mycena leptocephala]
MASTSRARRRRVKGDVTGKGHFAAARLDDQWMLVLLLRKRGCLLAGWAGFYEPLPAGLGRKGGGPCVDSLLVLGFSKAAMRSRNSRRPLWDTKYLQSHREKDEFRDQGGRSVFRHVTEPLNAVAVKTGKYSERIEYGKRKDQKKKEIISRGTSLFEGETLKTSLGTGSASEIPEHPRDVLGWTMAQVGGPGLR